MDFPPGLPHSDARPSGLFEVFVSSTSSDLGEVRLKVVALLIKKGYNASDLDSRRHAAGKLRDLIERGLQRADALVQLVGFSSGTFRNRSETWTQYEFRRAGELGIPVFPYFLSIGFVHALGMKPTDAEIELQSRYRNRIKKSGLLCNEVKSWEDLENCIESADYRADAARWQADLARRVGQSNKSLKRWSLLGAAAMALVAALLWLSRLNSGPSLKTSDQSQYVTPVLKNLPATTDSPGKPSQDPSPKPNSPTPVLPSSENKIVSTEIRLLFLPMRQEEKIGKISQDAAKAFFHDKWLTADERGQLKPAVYTSLHGYPDLPGIEGFKTVDDAMGIKLRFESLRTSEDNTSVFHRELRVCPW